MNNVTQPIEICFIASGDYAPFVATTALSIIENTQEDINIHVLTENFKEEEDKWTLTDLHVNISDRGKVSIDFIDVTEKLQCFAGASLAWFHSYIVYARIFIPELLISVSRCIYMDVDVIVNCDIKENDYPYRYLNSFL